MRKINEIIVHCTATVPSFATTVDDIRRWHIERGFSDIGYHYVVVLNGTVYPGRPIAQSGAHCRGKNAHSIGICYVGGLNIDGFPSDTRTDRQRASLEFLIEDLCNVFPIKKISSHYEYSNKACPCFDASKEYSFLIKSLL